MRIGKLQSALFLTAGIVLAAGTSQAQEPLKVLAPEFGMYHGTFPDLPDRPFSGEVRSRVEGFERLVGKEAAWVVVGNHWFEGIRFPTREVNEVLSLGKVPLVYVLPWSSRSRRSGDDFFYSLPNIIRGNLDQEIRAYARQVKAVRGPVMISFASEANGNWYPWSGVFSGAGDFGYGNPAVADGPERYVDAYRRFVDLFRLEGVNNVTWVFHVTGANKPTTRWNTVENYYPGDGYVDWIATSIYSAQEPGDEWEDFEIAMQHIYPDLESLSPTKPIAILEFATIEDRFNTFRKADWISGALTVLTSGRYPRVKGMTYWHESSWHPSGVYDLRVNSSREALRAYQSQIASPEFVERAVLSGRTGGGDDDGCFCGFRTNAAGRRACTVWTASGQVLEERLFSECSVAVCEQLMSPATVSACHGDFQAAR